MAQNARNNFSRWKNECNESECAGNLSEKIRLWEDLLKDIIATSILILHMMLKQMLAGLNLVYYIYFPTELMHLKT